MIPTDATFLKLDLKDFYMSGDHSLLVDQSSSILEVKNRSDFRLLLSSILGNQFIRFPDSPQVLKVCKGSGMGMICSGEVADATLYALVEKRFTLLPRVRRKYGILNYYRFNDDGIVIFDGKVSSDARFEFFFAFRDLSKPSSINVHSFSSNEFQMLDVLFWKGERFSSLSLLDFRLFTKPTSIWKPLSCESMHPLFVHRHWPMAQCKRIRKRFSCDKAGEDAVSAFKDRVSNLCGVQVSVGAKSPKHLLPTSWLVLPFCFAIGSEVSTAAASVIVPPCIRVFSKVRISWALGNKRLMHLITPNRGRLNVGNGG